MATTPLPDALLEAEQSPLLGPDAARLHGVLGGLCLDGRDEVAGRSLLRRAELKMVVAGLTLSRAALEEPTAELLDAIDDVTAAGPRLAEGSDHELQARLLAARLLLRTHRPVPAAELLDGIRATVRGKGRRTRLMLAMSEGELAMDAGAYAQADRHLRRAAALARGPALAHDQYQAAMGLAAVTQLQGGGAAAMPWFRLARGTALEFGDRPRLADACFALGNLLAQQGDVLGSLEALEEAVEAGLDPASQQRALMVLAHIALGMGRHEEGLQRAVQAARAGTEAGDAAAFAEGSIIAARCQAGLQDMHAAVATLDASAEALSGKGFDDLARSVLAERQRVVGGGGEREA